MNNEDMVLADEFCVHHNIELSFIQSLREYAMIETVVMKEKIFVPASQLPRLEKIVRLHFELDINLEGVETIVNLLGRMETMHKEIVRLENRLRAYER